MIFSCVLFRPSTQELIQNFSLHTHSSSIQQVYTKFSPFSSPFLFVLHLPPRMSPWRHENQFSSGVFSANRESPLSEEIAPGDGRTLFIFYYARIPPPPPSRDILSARGRWVAPHKGRIFSEGMLSLRMQFGGWCWFCLTVSLKPIFELHSF